MASPHSRHQQSSYIRQIIIRLSRDDITPDFEKGRDAFPQLQEAISQLALLRSVILESRNNTDNGDALAGLLRKGGLHVEQRTCEQAHSIHLKAKTSTAHLNAMPFLSPFWLLKRHCDEWRNWYVNMYAL